MMVEVDGRTPSSVANGVPEGTPHVRVDPLGSEGAYTHEVGAERPCQGSHALRGLLRGQGDPRKRGLAVDELLARNHSGQFKELGEQRGAVSSPAAYA